MMYQFVLYHCSSFASFFIFLFSKAGGITGSPQYPATVSENFTGVRERENMFGEHHEKQCFSGSSCSGLYGMGYIPPLHPQSTRYLVQSSRQNDLAVYPASASDWLIVQWADIALTSCIFAIAAVHDEHKQLTTAEISWLNCGTAVRQ